MIDKNQGKMGIFQDSTHLSKVKTVLTLKSPSLNKDWRYLRLDCLGLNKDPKTAIISRSKSPILRLP